MAKRRRCQVTVGWLRGKKQVCGMPLDAKHQCPQHGTPYDKD